MNKRRMKNWKNYGIYLALLCGAVLTSCNDDDDDNDSPDHDDVDITYANVVADDQYVSQNTMFVETADVPDDGWIVVYRGNGQGGPDLSEQISQPYYVEDGANSNLTLSLQDVDLNDGETVWVMLHKETNNNSAFDYDGESGVDNPFLDADDVSVKTSVIISSPMVVVQDQAVDVQVTVEQVEAGADGWLAVYNSVPILNTIDYGSLLGTTEIDKGSHSNVTVDLEPTTDYDDGQHLFVVLHIDNGTDGTFEFDNSDDTLDPIETFGNGSDNEIKAEFQVEE